MGSATPVLLSGELVSGPPHEGVGSVSQLQDHDDLTGCGSLQDVGQADAQLGGTEVAQDDATVGSQPSGIDSEGRRDRSDRSSVEPGDDEVIDVLDREVGRLQCIAERRLGQRDVSGLAETLLPLVGLRLTRYPPPVEELFAR
jgi:hypothetical protein